MGSILGFFGSAALGPAQLLRLKGLLIGAAVMIAVCLALTAWALLERSGKLSCEVEKEQLNTKIASLEAQVGTLSDKLTTQNDAVKKLEKAAADAKRKGADEKAKAERLVAGNKSELERLRKAASNKTTGATQSCADAVADVRRGLRP